MSVSIIKKTCIKCKSNKILSEFGKSSSYKEGYLNICKCCRSKQDSVYRKVSNNIIKENDLIRFFKYFTKTEFCWLWVGNKLPKEYGQFYFSHKKILAHRFSYLYHFGNLPQSLDVLHTCDNPSCVNPEHLFLGTNQDNVNDKVAKNRQRKGERIPSSKLNAKEVLEIRAKSVNGESSSSIAKEYAVNRRNISFIINRTTWKHI
jgi:HNH endonuclease